MVQVQASEAMMAVLGTLQGRAEVVDKSGAVIGYLIPAEGTRERPRREPISASSAEEYRRRKELSEGDERFTTDQVLDRLRSLGNS